MQIRFNRDYDHVEVTRTISYKAGQEQIVSRDVGRAAVKAKAASEIRNSKRGER